MTHAEEADALARRGALLVGWRDDRDYNALFDLPPSYGWNTPIDRGDAVTDRDLLADDDVSGALFVALLDKCDAERVDYQIARGHAAIFVDGGGLVVGRRKNRALALLLALDAAGLLPKEDA